MAARAPAAIAPRPRPVGARAARRRLCPPSGKKGTRARAVQDGPLLASEEELAAADSLHARFETRRDARFEERISRFRMRRQESLTEMGKKMRQVSDDDDDQEEDDNGGEAETLAAPAAPAPTRPPTAAAQPTTTTTAAVAVEELRPGQLYVHKDFGRCIFLGIETHPDKRRNNRPAPFVMLKFSDGLAKLPARQLKRHIYRARGDDADAQAMQASAKTSDKKQPTPRLGKLRDPSVWRRTMQRSRRTVDGQVSKLMDTLIRRLQVTREEYTAVDEALKREFYEKFGYALTPDQGSAVADVERDLVTEPYPMDRLVIGDVGYGKTEVAVRSIYIAAMNDRQVFVLAPTTVLASQHYKLLARRFDGVLSKSGVDIGKTMGLMCRGTTAKQRRDLLAGIAANQQLVTVGTHSLLSDKVDASNLSLLIVDEEQRFGVKQKERLRMARSEVDVLTLTATPIPRTLQWATLSLRQTSCIFTPPPGRKPIETIVDVFDGSLVYSAIRDELARGGQVYYVVPRIEPDMQDAVNFLQKGIVEGALPDSISWDLVNGGMKPTEMEKVMTRFGERDFDILIATSIVESGLDIPNVNTIIIPNAHYFGIASLYQLRGRVGRSDIEARAYLLYPESVAERLVEGSPSFDLMTYRRIEALRECCSGLGLGYRLAERDAEIRGMGELMGFGQTDRGSGGTMATVGPDLYMEQVFDALQRVERQHIPPVAGGARAVQLQLWCGGQVQASFSKLPRGETTWPAPNLGDASVAKLEGAFVVAMDNEGALGVERMYRNAALRYKTAVVAPEGDPLAPKHCGDERVGSFVQLLMIRSLCVDLGIYGVAGGMGSQKLPPPMTGFDSQRDVWLLTTMNQETYDMMMIAANAADGGMAMEKLVKSLRDVAGVNVTFIGGDVEEGGGGIALRGLGEHPLATQVSTVCDLLSRMREGLPEYIAYV